MSRRLASSLDSDQDPLLASLAAEDKPGAVEIKPPSDVATADDEAAEDPWTSPVSCSPPHSRAAEAALARAGDWLERLQIIELRSPAAALNWASVLRGQLEPLGFRPSDRDMLWQRPGVLMLRFLLERLQTQREQLVLERDEQMQGRQVMGEQLEEVMQQLQDVLLERDELKKHLADVQVQMTETHRDELEQLQNRWDRRESELQLQALQQESFVATSAAQLTLLTDLLARWGKDRSD